MKGRFPSGGMSSGIAGGQTRNDLMTARVPIATSNHEKGEITHLTQEIIRTKLGVMGHQLRSHPGSRHRQIAVYR
jgi:hypothetical protein